MRPIDHRAIDPKQFSARPRRLRRDVRNRRERYDRFQKINHPSPEARVNTQSLHEILQQTDRKDLKIRFNLMHASVFLKQERVLDSSDNELTSSSSSSSSSEEEEECVILEIAVQNQVKKTE